MLFEFIRKFKQDKKNSFLIVGLGNPGKEYENTRHNFGFMVLNALAQKWQINYSFKKRFSAFLGNGIIKDQPVMLLFPLTYMNLSGRAVKEAVKYNNIMLGKILIIHDEIDLKYGTIRLRLNGGTGGHKGLESIVSCMASKEFSRLRLGIGTKTTEDEELSDFVLSEFSLQEKNSLSLIMDNAILAIETFINEGIDKAMQNYNKR